MEMNYAKTVEKWGTLEVAVKGRRRGILSATSGSRELLSVKMRRKQ